MVPWLNMPLSPSAPTSGDHADRQVRPVSGQLATALTTEDALVARLARLAAREAAAEIAVLPAPAGSRALSRLSGAVVGPILAQLPLDRAVALLDAVPPARLPTLLASLSPQRAASARIALCSPPGSAARLLSDAFVQATPETSAAVARERFDAATLITPPARDLFIVDGGGRLLGVVPRVLLDTASPDQPVSTLVRPALAISYGVGPSALAVLLARTGRDALPVVSETGLLLGVVHVEVQTLEFPHRRGRASPVVRSVQGLRIHLLAALIVVTLVLAGLSTLDPPFYQHLLLHIG